MSDTKNCQDCYKFNLLCNGTAKLTALDDCFKSKTEAPMPQDSLGSAEFALLDDISEKLTGLLSDMSNGFYEDTSQALGQIKLHGEKVEVQIKITRNPDDFLL